MHMKSCTDLQIKFQPLFATSSLEHFELQNAQGRRVKQEMQKKR